MNKKKTKKLLDAILEELVAQGYNNFAEIETSSNILYHIHFYHNIPQIDFRDESKNACRISMSTGHIYLIAEINKAGVGDSKLPKKALTYDFGISIPGIVRMFRKHYYYPNDLYHRWTYDRTFNEIMIKFKEALEGLKELHNLVNRENKQVMELSEGKDQGKRTNTRPRTQKQSIKPPRQKR